MTRRRRPRGLAARFFLAQAIVVGAGILAAVAVASLAGPPIFHEHLVMSGHAENSPEMLHVERAYVDAGLAGIVAWCADYPDTATLELLARDVVPNFR